MQERELKAPKQDFTGEKKKISDTTIQQQTSTSENQSTNSSVSHSDDGNGLSSLFSILPSVGDINSTDEQQKRRPRLS